MSCPAASGSWPPKSGHPRRGHGGSSNIPQDAQPATQRCPAHSTAPTHGVAAATSVRSPPHYLLPSTLGYAATADPVPPPTVSPRADHRPKWPYPTAPRHTRAPHGTPTPMPPPPMTPAPCLHPCFPEICALPPLPPPRSQPDQRQTSLDDERTTRIGSERSESVEPVETTNRNLGVAAVSATNCVAKQRNADATPLPRAAVVHPDDPTPSPTRFIVVRAKWPLPPPPLPPPPLPPLLPRRPLRTARRSSPCWRPRTRARRRTMPSSSSRRARPRAWRTCMSAPAASCSSVRLWGGWG